MTNIEMIWGIAITIFSAGLSVALTIVLSIYAKEYIPDTKTLNSYIRKLLAFTFRYISPTTILILSFIFDDFNKLFIIKITILTFVLLISFIVDYTDKKVRNLTKETATCINLLRDLSKLQEKEFDLKLKSKIK